MLQQTQVDRVKKKYKSFLKKFPTPKSLAQASLREVLIEWQGLGYNRRAKFLKSLSEEVLEAYSGKIPEDVSQLIKLPGIGQSTAGALCAFAFNKPVIFIETNIRRVYIQHFFKNKKDVHDSEILKRIGETLDTKNPREWYWALMDYGSHIPKQTENPNRKSRHYVKQSTFKGSKREVRGKILKFLSQKTRTTYKELRSLPFEENKLQDALQELAKEGFIIRKGRAFTIAH